jgi:ABC-2 type transport system permease protein
MLVPTKAWVIARKDLDVLKKEKAFVVVFILIIFFLGVITPIGIHFIAMPFLQELTLNELKELFRGVPWLYNLTTDMLKNFAGENLMETSISFMDTMMIVIFLFFSATIPMSIASYSVIGEKVNRSIEPILVTPTGDIEFLAGKSLSAFLPAIIAIYISFTLFTVVSAIFGYYILDLRWVVSMFALTPLFCIMSTVLNVLASSKAKDPRTAVLIGMFAVSPVFAILGALFLGVTTLGLAALSIFCVLVALCDVFLFYLARETFGREKAILAGWG